MKIKSIPRAVLLGAIFVSTTFLSVTFAATGDQLKGTSSVMKGYLEGVSQLAQDNFDKAFAGFKQFGSDLKNLSDKTVSTEKDAVQKELEKALSSKDMPSLRVALKPLSEKVYDLYQKGGFEKQGINAYVCSMKSAKWFSLSSKVENPYYGASMFGCGEKLGSKGSDMKGM